MNELRSRHPASPLADNGGNYAGTILFVEDEAAICSLATIYLERNGYRVIAARDGAEALALWPTCASEVDVVFADLIMPRGINGYQLVQRLRVDRPDVAVIFTSGYDCELPRAEAFQDRIAHFLPKPYRLGSLAEVVRQSLENSPPRKPAVVPRLAPPVKIARPRRCRVGSSEQAVSFVEQAQLSSAA